MSDRPGVEVGQIELTERQRQRLDRIKAECENDHLPEPSDSQIVDSLLDTWEAVGDGLYSDGVAESGKALEVSVENWRLGVYVTRTTSQEDCAE